MNDAFDKDFRTFITPLSGQMSAGKWDYRVVVVRLSDGCTKQEKVSGGWSVAEAVARRLQKELANL